MLFQGEIRVTGFNQEVDKFYSLIEAGKVRFFFQIRFSMSKLCAKTAFHFVVEDRFGGTLFHQQLPVL